MKVIRLDDSGTKTPSGKLPDESRKKKRNPPAVRWSGTSEESGENAGGKGAENTAPAQRTPTYSEIMEKYLAGRYADALAGNRRTAEAEADAAERDAQDALERIRGGYKNTDRQLYREYMESTRTLPQRLAAQGITGGLTESSQVRLANSYGEELAENERARLAEEAKAYSARDARLAAAKSERERADAEAKKTHSESLAKLWQEEEKRRRAACRGGGLFRLCRHGPYAGAGGLSHGDMDGPEQQGRAAAPRVGRHGSARFFGIGACRHALRDTSSQRRARHGRRRGVYRLAARFRRHPERRSGGDLEAAPRLGSGEHLIFKLYLDRSE